ncbi:uncharacterized protein KD926_003041 [Aspergillus affinis]|uniref:uncharacterized protein n=1 Tax=Aspergillus affinis TaxID=1070780 RepID=UPI0022FF1640|nr:uncharacterized protein KD926_003041 [Aspergillus affinis]KAI9043691.1 hypothetical protein KD926_003041 [Aspergillus affinis]
MLRLGPTRIFLGEEDLRYHLGRVYLRQTESASGYNTDQASSDEDEDEYEDEDDETSIDSLGFSPYALSQFKVSNSSFASERDSWPSQDRWPKNWRTNAVGLPSTLAESTTLETSLVSASSVCADFRVPGLVGVTDANGTLTRRASARSRYVCYTGLLQHSPQTNTPTLTSLKSGVPLSSADEKTRSCKLLNTNTTGNPCLSFRQELESSTDLSVSLPLTTLTLDLEHTASHQHKAALSPKSSTQLSQQTKFFHPSLSIKTYPSAYPVPLNPLVKILNRLLQEGLIVKAAMMNGATESNNSGPWRRGAVRTRNPMWQHLNRLHGTGATDGPERTSAALASDSQDLPEPVASAESPRSPAAERPRNESDSEAEKMDKVRRVMSISSLAPADNHVEIRSRHGARSSDADVELLPRGSATMREPDLVASTMGPAHLTHDRVLQQNGAVLAGPLDTSRVILTHPVSSTAGIHPNSRATSREQPLVTYGPVGTMTETSPAAGLHYSSAIAREQPTATYGRLEAIRRAAPAVRVQPFTPVNPPSRTRQEGSATPHGSHPEPNSDDAIFKAEADAIEKRLNRMISGELQAAKRINIYDYGLGALRRKPLGEWYREAVNKDM